MQFSLQAQISEVERELALRRNFYPRQVAAKRMKEAEAEYHLGRMESALRTLRWLEKHEIRIKALLNSEGTDDNSTERKDGGGAAGGGGDGGEPGASSGSP